MKSLTDESWRFTPATFANRASLGRFKVEPHIRFLSNKIAATIQKGGGRLLISAPPRHGKSTLISQWLPIWYLEHWPHKRVVVAAYGDEIACEWGRKVRNEFADNELLQTKLRDDSKAAGRWNTPAGGGMVSVGVGGPLSGRGYDVGICDDLLKNWQDAYSVTVQMHLWDWWKSTFYTRAEPNATIIVGMTRWGTADIIAQLIEEQPGIWEVINLPALAEDNDPLGRPIGEPLCPSRYDKAALEKIRVDVGANVWNALYQQRPDPFGAGRLFNRFSAANIDEKVVLRADMPLALSLDFNINPGNHGIVGQYDNRKDLFTITDEFYGPRMDIRTLMRQFTEWLKVKGWIIGARLPFPEIHIYGDATGESEWSGTAESCYDLVRHHLKMCGLPYKIRHLTKNPPLRESIDATNEAFKDVQEKVHVRVHPRCKGLIVDLNKARADESGLIDKKDDALGHYCMIAETLVDTPIGPRSIINLKNGDEVFTHLGIGRVEGLEETGERETFKLQSDTGRYIVCTGDHPIYCDGQWIETRFINGRQLWLREEAFRMDERSRARQSPTTGDILFSGQKDITNQLISMIEGSCTRLSGKITMDLFQVVLTFITKMKSRLTTGLRISNALQRQSIIETGMPRNWLARLLRHQHGMHLQPALNGIGRMQSRTDLEIDRWSEENAISAELNMKRKASLLGFARMHAKQNRECFQASMTLSLNALFAELNTRTTNTRRRALAPRNARPHGVARVESMGLTEKVYALKTSDGSFYANGILVSNCDCARYWISYMRPLYRVAQQSGGVVGGVPNT